MNDRAWHEKENGTRVYDRYSKFGRECKEFTTRCIHENYDKISGHYYQCLRSRGHGKDGLYCKQHGRMMENRLG